jgi:hypothetical protein
MLYWVHLTWTGFELTALVVIGIDCISSYKSNYHTIMATTVPKEKRRHLVIILTSSFSRYVKSLSMWKIKCYCYW